MFDEPEVEERAAVVCRDRDAYLRWLTSGQPRLTNGQKAFEVFVKKGEDKPRTLTVLAEKIVEAAKSLSDLRARYFFKSGRNREVAARLLAYRLSHNVKKRPDDELKTRFIQRLFECRDVGEVNFVFEKFAAAERSIRDWLTPGPACLSPWPAKPVTLKELIKVLGKMPYLIELSFVLEKDRFSSDEQIRLLGKWKRTLSESKRDLMAGVKLLAQFKDRLSWMLPLFPVKPLAPPEGDDFIQEDDLLPEGLEECSPHTPPWIWSLINGTRVVNRSVCVKAPTHF